LKILVAIAITMALHTKSPP